MQLLFSVLYGKTILNLIVRIRILCLCWLYQLPSFWPSVSVTVSSTPTQDQIRNIKTVKSTVNSSSLFTALLHPSLEPATILFQIFFILLFLHF